MFYDTFNRAKYLGIPKQHWEPFSFSSRSHPGMKFANKMINTTGSPLIRDEICGARRSHDDDNYYRALHYSRSCIGNYESFLQLFERARNIQTHIPSTIHTLTRSLRTEKLCLIIYNESLVCSMSCINNPGKARILILAVTSKRI